jgi:hypothetical protein
VKKLDALQPSIAFRCAFDMVSPLGTSSYEMCPRALVFVGLMRPDFEGFSRS